jgi:hypothetical protein
MLWVLGDRFMMVKQGSCKIAQEPTLYVIFDWQRIAVVKREIIDRAD